MKGLLIFAVAALAAAQEDTRFAVGSRLVLVPATVSDAKGRSVEDLEASNFLVLDNGRPQKIAVDTIGTGIAPIALVIAVQAAGVSAAVLEKVLGIGGMIQPLVTGERGCAGLISFSDRVTWLQECTTDAAAIERAFYKLRLAEPNQARMLDAVESAVEHLQRKPNARRVLLLISESRDRGSETGLEAAAAAAQAAGVTVYAATYSAFKTAFTSQARLTPSRQPERPNTPNPAIHTIDGTPGSPPLPPPEQRVDLLAGIRELVHLHQANSTAVLAEATGGTTFSFTTQKALDETIRKFGAELHSQYLLSFVPDPLAPGYHKLEVRVTRPGEFRIRARPGYWSEEKQP